MRKRTLFSAAVIGIFIVSFLFRMWHVTAPLADWHSWRQADTAAVARNFVRLGIDVLHPRYDDLSNIQSGRDNPQGWRMVELPLYQAAGAFAHATFPGISLLVWLRIITALASSITSVLIILLLTTYATPVVGISAGVVYAVLPYSIYYGRVILPEPLSVCFAMASLWVLSRIKKSGTCCFLSVAVAAFCAAAAVLVKPTSGFLLLPSIYQLYRVFKLSWKYMLATALYTVLSIVPFILWRSWILHFPEGIPVYVWLLNDNGIRFKGAWFWWLFAKRIGELILGYWGLVVLGFGCLAPRGRYEQWFTGLLLAGSVMYLSIFATGNVQHDYYQILLLPILSVFLAKGIVSLLMTRTFGAVRFALLGISVCFMLAFSWYTVRTYYWVNRPAIVTAGRHADAILPKEAKVIAPYNGDTTFLYQTGRQGWPLGFDIDDKIQKGATHYVTVSPTDEDGETMALASRFTVLVRNDEYAIIDLTRPKDPKVLSQ